MGAALAIGATFAIIIAVIAHALGGLAWATCGNPNRDSFNWMGESAKLFSCLYAIVALFVLGADKSGMSQNDVRFTWSAIVGSGVSVGALALGYMDSLAPARNHITSFLRF